MICLLQNLTRQLDNIDIVPPVQGLGVEQGPVLLGSSVPEEPGVGVVVLCVPPRPSHGAAVRPGLAVWQVDCPGRGQRPRHLLQREAAGPGRVPGAQLVRRTPRPHTRPPAAHQVTTVRQIHTDLLLEDLERLLERYSPRTQEQKMRTPAMQERVK